VDIWRTLMVNAKSPTCQWTDIQGRARVVNIIRGIAWNTWSGLRNQRTWACGRA